MRARGIRDARQVARAVVYRLGVSAPEHVRLEAFVSRFKARIVEAPLDGAQAQLVRAGTDVMIVVSDRITDPAARRFCIAHELAHLVLEHPTRPASELCEPQPTAQADPNRRDYEAEANAFASELLMPQRLIQKWCDVSPVDLAVSWRIANAFEVSILAAATRFVELSPERCVAVFSSKGVVRWVRPSATFTREIVRGKRLDRGSVAWDFFATGAIDDRAQPVPADAWIETSTEVDIVEHSTASREFGTVLSLLWIPERSASSLGMFE